MGILWKALPASYVVMHQHFIDAGSLTDWFTPQQVCDRIIKEYKAKQMTIALTDSKEHDTTSIVASLKKDKPVQQKKILALTKTIDKHKRKEFDLRKTLPSKVGDHKMCTFEACEHLKHRHKVSECKKNPQSPL